MAAFLQHRALHFSATHCASSGRAGRSQLQTPHQFISSLPQSGGSVATLSVTVGAGPVAPQRRCRVHRRHSVCASAVSGGSGDPTVDSLKATAAYDELIDRLLSAKNEQELARLVAENIISIDSKFWLRVATRNDTAAGAQDKDRLKTMADNVLTLVNTVLQRTEQQLADSSKILQEIMTSAANEKGEWYLPLAPEQVASLRASLEKNADRLDEALLSNCFAWIRKCNEDGFDTMVALIQKVLQLYAAKVLQGGETTGVAACVNQVVYAEENDWAPTIKRMAQEGEITEPAFMEELQRKMEAIVLGLQSGSYAQRVQAEYLKEVEARARSVFKELAASSST